MTQPHVPQLETARLVLRPFAAADLDAWARRIFADPEVIRYLPRRDISPRERAGRAMQYFDEHWAQYGYGLWAVTDKADGQFIGHAGLNYLQDTGEVEVDYALARAYWGRGIATEAARASVRFGFESAKLERIIGLVVPENIAARRVLEHVGLRYNPLSLLPRGN